MPNFMYCLLLKNTGISKYSKQYQSISDGHDVLGSHINKYFGFAIEIVYLIIMIVDFCVIFSYYTVWLSKIITNF